jgi:hypothetical protein
MVDAPRFRRGASQPMRRTPSISPEAVRGK